MIDLHIHTTASDGSLSPAALVARAAAAGLTTISVTDHDTFAGLFEARTAAGDLGLRFVNGVVTHIIGDNDLVPDGGCNVSNPLFVSPYIVCGPHEIGRAHV